MNQYLKCLLSFVLGGLCVYLGTTMAHDKDQTTIAYFLYVVGGVNFYIGIKDLISIFKNKE